MPAVPGDSAGHSDPVARRVSLRANVPFVRGSAALYSREYFEAEKAHLTPGGIVTQWVPLYESDTATVKSEIATFLAVFPDGLIFANTDAASGVRNIIKMVAGGLEVGPILMGMGNQAHIVTPSITARFASTSGFVSK